MWRANSDGIIESELMKYKVNSVPEPVNNIGKRPGLKTVTFRMTQAQWRRSWAMVSQSPNGFLGSHKNTFNFSTYIKLSHSGVLALNHVYKVLILESQSFHRLSLGLCRLLVLLKGCSDVTRCCLQCLLQGTAYNFCIMLPLELTKFGLH